LRERPGRHGSPVPFSTGDTLELPISGYEGTITCDWYNVPASPHGQVTVITYSCTTESFVSEVDCEIFEHGQGFDLSWWDGASWVFQADGTTDGAGVLTFADLQPGTWQLDEQDASWCAISSDDLSSDGSSLHVEAGKESVVKVYNCGAPTTWTTPTRYPNTGVAPIVSRP
jgi:hypothetical protein